MTVSLIPFSYLGSGASKGASSELSDDLRECFLLGDASDQAPWGEIIIVCPLEISSDADSADGVSA